MKKERSVFEALWLLRGLTVRDPVLFPSSLSHPLSCHKHRSLSTVSCVSLSALMDCHHIWQHGRDKDDKQDIYTKETSSAAHTQAAWAQLEWWPPWSHSITKLLILIRLVIETGDSAEPGLRVFRNSVWERGLTGNIMLDRISVQLPWLQVFSTVSDLMAKIPLFAFTVI